MSDTVFRRVTAILAIVLAVSSLELGAYFLVAAVVLLAVVVLV